MAYGVASRQLRLTYFANTMTKSVLEDSQELSWNFCVTGENKTSQRDCPHWSDKQ
jgi:hypothetical protein